MKKIIKLFLLLLIMPIVTLNAENKEKVVINKYYINSEIEIAGALNIKQFIELSENSEEFDLSFETKKLNSVEFTGVESDLKGSNIYNPTSVDKLKIGVLKEKNDVDLASLINENLYDNVEFLDECTEEVTEKCYKLESNEEGTFTIKLLDASKDNVYYLEYLITNILVEHTDSAEFYYPFFTNDFAYNIKDVQISVALPYPADKVYEVYAHGPKSAIVNTDEEKRGAIAQILNYKSNTSFDLRMLFDKEYFSININESKKSKLEALPIIKKIESERNDSTKKNNLVNSVSKIGILSIEGIYIISVLGISVYSYLKILKRGKNKNKLTYDSKLSLAFYLLGILGIVIFVADALLGISFIKYIVLCTSILFILYVLLFLSKRKKK